MSQGGLVDLIWVQFLGLHLFGDFFDRRQNFGAGAVRYRQIQLHSLVACGQLFGPLELFPATGRQKIQIPEGMQGDFVFHQRIQLGLHGFYQQLHEGLYFQRRARPVFGRKGVKRQIFNAQFGAYFTSLPHRLNRVAMAINSVLSTLLGPSTVPIHDNSHVGRNPLGIDLLFHSAHPGSYLMRQRRDGIW